MVKFHQLRVYDVVSDLDPELYLALRSVAPHHKDFILLNRFASSRIMLVCLKSFSEVVQVVCDYNGDVR